MAHIFLEASADMLEVVVFPQFSGLLLLTQVKAPALIVQGDQDAVVPTPAVLKALERLQQRPAGAATSYVELPRCGHIPMEEYPREFVDSCASFLHERYLDSN